MNNNYNSGHSPFLGGLYRMKKRPTAIALDPMVTLKY